MLLLVKEFLTQRNFKSTRATLSPTWPPNIWIPCLVLWKHTLDTLDHVFEELEFFGFGVQSIDPVTQLPCALGTSGHVYSASSEPHVLGSVHNDLSSTFAHDGKEHDSDIDCYCDGR